MYALLFQFALNILNTNRFVGRRVCQTKSCISSSGELTRQSLSLLPEERDSLRWDLRTRNADEFEVRRDSAHLLLGEGGMAPRVEKEFIDFATSPVQLAKLAEIIPYGPARTSALLRVGKNSVSGTPISDHLPNAPHHKRRAIVRDSAWYSNTASLRQRRFDAWLETK